MEYARQTDEELVKRYAEENDGDAFVEIVNRYLKPMYNFVYRLTGSAKDAEEIAQETFVKIWKNIAKFKTGERFKTWAYAIARNTAIDWLRKRRHVPFSEFESEDGSNVLEETIASEEPDAVAFVEASENVRFAAELLESLPPHYKEVLFLYYNEGLNLEEVSRVLKKPLNTVKSQHRRALIALRGKTAPEKRPSAYQ